MLGIHALKCCAIAATFASASDAAGYNGQGMILAVDPARRQIVISHDRIDGLMPAMTMPFTASPAVALTALKPGMRVTFRLDVSKSATRLVRVTAAKSKPATDVPIAPAPDAVKPGLAVPDFTLVNQHGAPTRLSDSRGRVTVVDFIYTRCPLPEVCPRLSANFARLGRRFAGQAVSLVSITLDPQYDTPGILARYAKRWSAKPEQWNFLTGPLEDIQRIAVSLGMAFWPEDGSITHTTRTVVIDKQGRLAAAVEGSSYIVDQLGDLIAHYLEKQP